MLLVTSRGTLAEVSTGRGLDCTQSRTPELSPGGCGTGLIGLGSEACHICAVTPIYPVGKYLLSSKVGATGAITHALTPRQDNKRLNCLAQTLHQWAWEGNARTSGFFMKWCSSSCICLGLHQARCTRRAKMEPLFPAGDDRSPVELDSEGATTPYLNPAELVSASSFFTPG